ncbi:MAG: GNAT family N-acetyltransferase [Candidatus Neomarinimicrobiota bacterium]
MSTPELDLIILSHQLAQDHAPRLLELINSIPGRKWSSQELLAERPDKFRFSRIWIGAEGVLGLVLASRKGMAVHIHQVVVPEAHRRQGLGRQAYGAIADQACEAGLASITANCLKSDKRAVEFHRALDFVIKNSYIDPDDGRKYLRLSCDAETVGGRGQPT